MSLVRTCRYLGDSDRLDMCHADSVCEGEGSRGEGGEVEEIDMEREG